MSAAIITIGTELTSGRVVDINSAWLMRDLEKHGLRASLSLTVPDSPEDIGNALEFVLKQKPPLVIVAGGLGPTHDDLTAPAVATALGLKMELNPTAAKLVAAAVGVEKLKAHQLKQATLPAGSAVLMPVGSAPGFIVDSDGAPVVVLPGVPMEMKAMWQEAKTDLRVAAALDKGPGLGRLALCFYGPGEPDIGEAAESLLDKIEGPLEVGICSRLREVRLEVAFPIDSQAQAESLISSLRESFDDYVYSAGEEIEEVIAAEMIGQGKTLAVAESCTGGMVGSLVTGVSGSSDFFRGGIVAYHNDIKRTHLKVRQEALAHVGAVSEPVAQQMAIGARTSLKADYGIGITGVAGPTGGTPEKPAGLVFICVSSEAGDLVRKFNFPGGRSDVREASVVAALHLLHEKLLGETEL